MPRQASEVSTIYYRRDGIDIESKLQVFISMACALLTLRYDKRADDIIFALS